MANNDHNDFDPREVAPMVRTADDTVNVGKWMTRAMLWKRRYVTQLEDYNYLRETVRKLLYAIDVTANDEDPDVIAEAAVAIQTAVDELVAEFERKQR